jgi:hypothetical protein
MNNNTMEIKIDVQTVLMNIVAFALDAVTLDIVYLKDSVLIANSKIITHINK